MPRERKYKVWDKENKEWIELTGDTFLSYSNGKLEVIEGDEHYAATLENVEIVEYTGLKDKNGIEICEGDIYHQGDKNIRYLVVWNDTGLIGKQIGSSSYAGLQYWQRNIEVIGNIYENSELMEG